MIRLIGYSVVGRVVKPIVSYDSIECDELNISEWRFIVPNAKRVFKASIEEAILDILYKTSETNVITDETASAVGLILFEEVFKVMESYLGVDRLAIEKNVLQRLKSKHDYHLIKGKVHK